MPKKYFFYCIGLLLLVVLGIYGFTKWTEAREKVNLWTLVPDDAVFVVESANHDRLVEGLKEARLWEQVASLQPVETFATNLQLLDSVSGRNEGTSRFLRRKKLLSSAHVVGRNKFDFVFYLPINTVGEHRFVRSLVENMGKTQLFTSSTYTYQGQLVTTIKNEQTGDSFFFFSFHNNIILSVNPNLIKEIIRKISRGQLESPAAEYEQLNYLEQPEAVAQVFVNYRHLPQLLNVFLKEELMPDVRYFSSLGRSAMLGFRQQQGLFLLDGISRPEPFSDSFYNRIKDQAPQPFGLSRFLPVRTALLLHLGLEQVKSARHRYLPIQKQSWPAAQTAWADSLVGSFQQELGIAYMESNRDPRNSEKILFARTSQPARTQQLLNSLIGQVRAKEGLKAASGRSGTYSWQQVPVREFPMLLFGSAARGFESCYVSQVDSFTVFAPDLSSLRLVLSDIRDGQVWARHPARQALLAQTRPESNFSVYLNTASAWKMLVRQMRPGQRTSLLRQENLLKKFTQVALQIGLGDKVYHTRLVLTYPVTGSEDRQPAEAMEVQQQFTLPDELIAAPWLVRPPGGRTSQLFVQDEQFRLYRLQANGQVAWTHPMEQPVTSPIYPVSFGADNQAGYLFAGVNSIFCLDAGGRAAPNFPFHLPDTVEITQMAVLSLRHSHEPRLLIGDQAGHLSMMDMAGNLQEGWAPKSLDAPLAAVPQLFQVNGRDVLLIMLQNGYIYAFNSLGELYPGFPLNLDAPLAQPAFGRPGASLRQTQLTVISQIGQRVTFNLAGQILREEKLPATPGRNARFEMISDPTGRSYIISRQERGKMSLFSQNLQLLLEKNFITSSRKITQYFDFGALNRIYVLTETGPGKTYLYNYQAQPIGEEPLDNRLPVSLQYLPGSRRYALYNVTGNKVNRIVFRDR